MSDPFVVWKRKPGRPGHGKIIVYSFPSGDLEGQPRPGPKGESEVQCYTPDRIPFCMAKRRLIENYERSMDALV